MFIDADKMGWPIAIMIDDVTLYSNGMLDVENNCVTYFNRELSMKLTREEVEDFKVD